MNGKIDFDFPGHIWPGLWPRGASSIGRGLSGSVGFLILAEERQWSERTLVDMTALSTHAHLAGRMVEDTIVSGLFVYKFYHQYVNTCEDQLHDVAGVL